jgi:hypothetical protein
MAGFKVRIAEDHAALFRIVEELFWERRSEDRRRRLGLEPPRSAKQVLQHRSTSLWMLDRLAPRLDGLQFPVSVGPVVDC